MTYFSVNPETGEPTKDHEFTNSWKWDEPERKEFNSQNEHRKALCDKYRVPQDTPFEAVEQVRKYKRRAEFHGENYKIEKAKNTEYLNTLEATSYQIKHLEQEAKLLRKKTKKFLKDIEPYLTHKEDCLVTMMNIVGRAKIKSKCNCGLSELLKQVS